jgi:hypothetical protein
MSAFIAGCILGFAVGVGLMVRVSQEYVKDVLAIRKEKRHA